MHHSLLALEFIRIKIVLGKRSKEEMPRNSRRNNESMNSLAVSYVSEIAGEFSPPPSRIPMAKWQEILEDEHASHIVGSIREEIIRSAADAICEGYFRRAVYGFVVNCAYEAWMRAFQVIREKLWGYDNAVRYTRGTLYKS